MNNDTNFTDIDELVRIIFLQSAYPPQTRTLFRLINALPFKERSLTAITSFNYGFIEGKRAERARRKRAV